MGAEVPTPPAPQALCERLEAVFRAVAAGPMAGLPIVNPALGVAVVGLRPWAVGHLGVLVTPWCLNLVYIPAPGEAVPEPGRPRVLELPVGDIEFLGAAQPELGPYLAASLFSPMSEFASQDEALAVAWAVLDEVLTPPTAPPRTVSRRALLRGLIGREGP